MVENNNNGPAWYPEHEPTLAPKTNDWMRLVTGYVWSLRGQTSNINQTVQNLNQNVTQQITAISQNIANAANNNATVNAPVLFGTHADRLSSFPASSYSGYLYVETDRFQACYYSNGTQWILLEGAATGSFESRYTSFNAADAGFQWIETSRNNVTGLPPFPLYRWDGGQWDYQSGQFYRNQNALGTLAGSFNSANSNSGNDVGAIVNVTDFAGQLQWQANNTWFWGPDDDGRHGEGPIAREVDPSGSWWHLYDGSNNVTYLQANGNLGNVNLPNLTSAANVAFLEFGNNSSGNGVIPPVAPTFSGGSASGNFSGIAEGNSNTFNTSNFALDANNGSPALTGPNPIGINIPTAGLFTANNVTGNVSNNGQPPSIVRRAWFRR